MGLFNQIKRQTFRSGAQRPWDGESIVQVVGVKPQGDDLVTLEVLYFPDEVSVWQPPMKETIRSVLPDGVQAHVGQRLWVGSVGSGSGYNTPPPVYWDRPEPDLPPMQFPNVPGGDDPKVMLEFLEGMVKQGTLDQDGLDRARDYLEAGWTDGASGL